MHSRFATSMLIAALGLVLQEESNAGTQEPNRPAVPGPNLPACGEIYAEPMARKSPAVQPRQCLPPVKRTYSPRHRGLGYEILTLESEACFVPDDEFRLRDKLIDQSSSAFRSKLGKNRDWRSQAVSTFSAIGTTLVDNGFQLYIPTATLGDALVQRPLENGGKYIADCDTSSFIYLSVAEALSLPMNMVEITLPGGAGHNYVRWNQAQGESIDWDTNGRAQCQTPTGLPSWQGRTMSRQNVLGYAIMLRGFLWEKQEAPVKALADYRKAYSLYPESPVAYNNFAWLVSTKKEFNEPALIAEAMKASEKAISIERSANYLDTLACVQAGAGDFSQAISTEEDVLALDRSNEAFSAHLAAFRSTPAKNCIGM